MKKWDVFISHASEDKDLFALPLYNFLRKAGLRIWLDKTELSIGDSLREKIEEGLAQSRFGIVIISESFLQKRWPQRELNGLFGLEEEGQKVILPVWCNIDKSTVLKYSPILADKLAGDFNKGIEMVGRDLLKIILNQDSSSPSLEAPTLTLLLNNVIDNSKSTTEIKEFLQVHTNVLFSALGVYGSKGNLHWNISFPGAVIDCIASEVQMTTGIKKFYMVSFLQLEMLFDENNQPVKELKSIVKKNEELRKWVHMNLVQAREIVQDINTNYEAIIVVGRRDRLQTQQRDLLRDFTDELLGISVRTYDWLIDATL